MPTKNTRLGFSRTAIALLLAATGIITPILWDWWSTKSELTITKEQGTNIIEKKTSVDGLSISYLGHEIETLSKIKFTLKNTGRTPIEGSDLVSPPTLIITQGELLKATIDSMSPDNLGAEITQNSSNIIIKFPLLNPGDIINLSALISGQDLTFKVESRIKNISKINVLDEKDQIKIRSSFSVSTYIVGFFLIIFILLFFALLGQAPKRNKQKTLLARGEIPFAPGDHSSTAVAYIENELSFLAKNRRKPLLEMALRDGEFLSERNVTELTTTIKNIINTTNPGGGAILILIICLLGAYYLYSNIVI
ncbi:hypothetical protein [Pseudomonas sp.]|uniref:hypothetical protein n=1 Tax=Pseudomonas sp. TaxID=306 RepID=UPI00273515F9|nr:hypothetical protein [Pseudomonas sp.]MDP2748945.1 hypothetical protein [Pseudomonas sp.]